MDHLYSNTTEHRKGQHLLLEHRVLIQTRLKDGWSANKIAKEIGCAPNIVRNEIRRGTVALDKGNILRYKATTGQATYEKNRQVCCSTAISSKKPISSRLLRRSSSKTDGRRMLASAMH